MTEQVTREFTVTHSTVYYPDGTTENIEEVEGYHHDGVYEAVDIADDEWTTRYSLTFGEPELHYTVDASSKKVFSMDNVRKIEADWTQELVAVADVEIETERRWLLGSKKVVKPENPDVTIWEKMEWEAMDQ